MYLLSCPGRYSIPPSSPSRHLIFMILPGTTFFCPFQPLTTTGPPIDYRLRSLIPSDSPECVTLTHFHKQTIIE